MGAAGVAVGVAVAEAATDAGADAGALALLTDALGCAVAACDGLPLLSATVHATRQAADSSAITGVVVRLGPMPRV